ncbi:MAG: hypothetical protein Q9227_009563 [Pyrenula ochraceoflavens]
MRSRRTSFVNRSIFQTPLRSPSRAGFHSSQRALVRAGDSLPNLEVLVEGSPGNKVNLSKELTGKGIVLGVPAAFSPSCSNSHVPGYLNHPKLKDAGKVFVVSVNDPFVTKAWGTMLDPQGKSGVRFLGDPSLQFTETLELAFDGAAIFGQHRSKRYALLIEDGKVKQAFVEPDNTGVNVSAAEKANADKTGENEYTIPDCCLAFHKGCGQLHEEIVWYPESLADKSFDNTGLLLEAPFDPIRRQMNSVLLTVDLTKEVAEEAIEGKHGVVVAYHPIIFRGLKSLTLADSQQQSLLRLALEGISVYSPHTAVDAVPNGMGDWMADIVTGSLGSPEPATRTATPPHVQEGDDTATDSDYITPAETSNESPERERASSATTEESTFLRPQRPGLLGKRAYSKPTYPHPSTLSQTDLTPSIANHKRTVIQPCAAPLPDGFSSSNTGYGRLVSFHEPQPLTHLIERIARGVGTPKGFPVAIPQGRQVEDMQIQTVGICPGSGGSIFKNCTADLLFTGELSHHEALAATERGAAVVTLFHSNSERGYLHSVMKELLRKKLEAEWEDVRKEMKASQKLDEEWKEALEDEDVQVEVSERDRDPYGVVILEESVQQGTKLS